jgi:hypothetical protein
MRLNMRTSGAARSLVVDRKLSAQSSHHAARRYAR